jgi:hypothetical protein
MLAITRAVRSFVPHPCFLNRQHLSTLAEKSKFFGNLFIENPNTLPGKFRAVTLGIEISPIIDQKSICDNRHRAFYVITQIIKDIVKKSLPTDLPLYNQDEESMTKLLNPDLLELGFKGKVVRMHFHSQSYQGFIA